MKLLDWIPLEKLDWKYLSYNPSPGAAIGYSFVALFPIVIPALPIAYIYKEINYK